MNKDRHFTPAFNIGDIIQTEQFLMGQFQLIGIDRYKLKNHIGALEWVSYTFEDQAKENRWYLIDDPALPALYCSVIAETDMAEDIEEVATHCGESWLAVEGDSITTDKSHLDLFYSKSKECYFAKEVFSDGDVMYFKSQPIVSAMVKRNFDA